MCTWAVEYSCCQKKVGVDGFSHSSHCSPSGMPTCGPYGPQTLHSHNDIQVDGRKKKKKVPTRAVAPYLWTWFIYSSQKIHIKTPKLLMSWLFPFPSAQPHSAYVIPLMPSGALTFSADAQHRHSALLSALTCPSHQGTTAHVQITRPRCLIHTFTLPLCFPLYRSTTTYAYLLWLYLARISDHHSHRSLHNRPPFAIEYLSLYPSYLLLVSLPHISSHFSISLPLFADI